MKSSFNFLKYRYITSFFSLAMVVIFSLFIGIKGLNFGLEFTGGVSVVLSSDQSIEIDEFREFLIKKTQKNNWKVQYFGTNESIVIQSSKVHNNKDGASASEYWQTLLSGYSSPLKIEQIDAVGPQVGSELSYSGFLAAIITLILILIYVSFRFQWRFALSSVVALVHDVLFVLGIFSIFGMNFDLNVLAAILAIIGYSLNDTIVIFDRLRSHLSKKSNESVSLLINQALNQTMSRTLATSTTTLLVLLALIVFAEESMFDFAFSMIIGVLVGTYSSVFVATNLLFFLGVQPNLSSHIVSKDELGGRP